MSRNRNAPLTVSLPSKERNNRSSFSTHDSRKNLARAKCKLNLCLCFVFPSLNTFVATRPHHHTALSKKAARCRESWSPVKLRVERKRQETLDTVVRIFKVGRRAKRRHGPWKMDEIGATETAESRHGEIILS